MSDWKSELENLGMSKWSELETLRNSNLHLENGAMRCTKMQRTWRERDEFESKATWRRRILLLAQVAEYEDKLKHLEIL
jgi:hypothetical protein